jgi:putative hydrolase of the HAD superfamily
VGAAKSYPEMIKAVIFDFGGVLAEEGFREGLRAIGLKNGLDPDVFFSTARELIYESGYVSGLAAEIVYWGLLREKAGITGSDEDNRQEILTRFILREEMFNLADSLKSCGIVIAILSDQTNWLDEINARNPFYERFDFVFNSYRMKKTKRDPEIFRDVCSAMGLLPEEALFVDDNADNVMNASRMGLKTALFTDQTSLLGEIKTLLG